MQDVKLTIATGVSSRTKVWTNKQLLWSELVAKLSESTQTRETLKEFIAASKEDQHRIKDVGGYVGGYLRKGKRSPESVGHRQLLTLDIDFATSDFFEHYCLLFDNAAFIHATHKHSALEPRYRLLMPLSRECSPDEYCAISRKVAGTLGIEMFDNTTFEVNRLMFWPSNPRDVEYYFEELKGPVLDADEVLASYTDWKDTSLWPTADRKLREIGDAAKKQEDPHLKRGIVGAFCRTYSIRDAIDKFLSEQYVEGVDGRYTYTAGSTSSGLIIYEDTFAYSHHGTDPAGGKLCNAFDLVRLHRFGLLDSGDKSSKSFAAMEMLAMEDAEVRKTVAKENIDETREAFGDALEDMTEEDFDWMSQLQMDTKKTYLSSASNLNLILDNDKLLKGLFKHNEFDGKRYIMRSAPWRAVEVPEPARNVDYAGVRNYIECMYKISSQPKIEDAMAIQAERDAWHPIRDYLNGLEWDGTERIEKLLPEYFGAEDTLYTRAVIRKFLVGAVARVMQPGCKFDLVPVLVGGQGLGKSTFYKKLGMSWFSDTFLGVHGKEALEQIQGAWIIELAELAGVRKADVESVKQFISKEVDQFRPAYARVSETFKRQCVFGGTSNRNDFLSDPTGNRRFLPVDVREEHATKNSLSSTDLTQQEVNQIWAEAMHLYEFGETLYLSKEEELLARAQQYEHSEIDERVGLIMQYLERRLPEDWEQRDIYDRRAFLESEEEGVEPRRYVCTAEIWCECLGKTREDMNRYATKDLNDILRTLPEWQAHLSTRNFKHYGKQKYYERKRN